MTKYLIACFYTLAFLIHLYVCSFIIRSFLPDSLKEECESKAYFMEVDKGIKLTPAQACSLPDSAFEDQKVRVIENGINED